MMKYLNVPIFIISFILGLIFVHLSDVPTEKIVVYPTPGNCGKIEYADKANNCFVFRQTKVACPKNGAKKIPIQE
jgi:hypothetical protein